MTSCDIAIIGAGAAGIAAARLLASQGRDVRLIEARNRVGGRLWTDHMVFPGIPFDRGAHWLHSASENPLVAEADRLGWRYDRTMTYKPRALFPGGGRQAPADLVQEARAAVDRAIAAIGARGGAGDRSFADCLPADLEPWRRLVWRTLAQMMGRDPDQCSAEDFARYRDTGEDWPVEDGYGALVAKLAEGLPVTLGTPARAIDRRERLLRIETDRGDIRATACIVTLPTSVLAAGGLAFRPDLPAALRDAMDDCPMGVFEKIAMRLDQPIEGLTHCYGDVIDGPPIGRTPVNLHVQPFGRPLLVAHVAGRAGEAVVAEGPDAMRAAGQEIVVHAFGADVARRIVATEPTGWWSDPWSRGSYGCCRPGRADARDRMAAVFDERIRFAGEHLWPTCFATAHGAWLSGEAAARSLSARP